jgi:hypothetical protein
MKISPLIILFYGDERLYWGFIGDALKKPKYQLKPEKSRWSGFNSGDQEHLQFSGLAPKAAYSQGFGSVWLSSELWKNHGKL